MARFVGNRLGLFQFADQRIFFGARLERRQRGRVQAMGKQREIPFGGERQQCKHVVVEGPAEHEIHGDRRGDRRGGRERRDRQVRRKHARYRDDQQHQEHHQRIRDDIETGGMDQDRRPAQTVKQIKQDESRPPSAGRGERGRFCQEPGAAVDDGGMNAEHAAGPCRGRYRLHPEAEQKAGCHHEQHDDVGRRDARLGILPKQFAIESRAGSAGRR